MRPILVTGSHRSGTTWVGRMLCASKEAGYIHEPFCPNRSPGWLTQPLPFWFMYIDQHNGGEYEEAVRDVVGLRYPFLRSMIASRSPRDLARQAQEGPRSLVLRTRGVRPLLKDPFALFSTEWLADTFDLQPVVMIRKPVAFVSSIKKLNWGFDYEVNWLAQAALIDRHLQSFRTAFAGYRGEVDLVGEGIVMWNALYTFVDDLRARRPEFLFVRYEDVAADPLPHYEAMFRRLGLTWTEEVSSKIASFSDPGNPRDVSPRRRRNIKRSSRDATETWRSRLTTAEIERVEKETAEVASRFYPD